MLSLVLRLRVSHLDAEQKTVQLRFRQRKGTFVFYRVLRRHDQEWVAKAIGDAVYRHLPFFHRFQQGGLGLGRRAVDLVGENGLCHDWTRTKLKFPRLGVEDRNAGYIRWQHVRRELDTIEGTTDGARQRLGHHRFANAWNIFQQNMATAKHAQNREANFVAFAQDNLTNAVCDPLRNLLNRSGGLPHLVCRDCCPYLLTHPLVSRLSEYTNSSIIETQRLVRGAPPSFEVCHMPSLPSVASQV